MAKTREQFASKLGFVMAAAGSAVGIGNLVGFPVNATKNGGGAFLFMYAIFVIFICLPVMMAELAAGRHTQKSPLAAYTQLGGGRGLWRISGWLALITPYMVAVFYSVITVWILGYLLATIGGNLHELSSAEYFGQFINTPKVFLYLFAIMTFVGAVLLLGVKDGIEKGAKIMMPLLFIMLVGLVIFVLTQDNAIAGVRYFMLPDFSKIDADVINGAMGQAFFSLSLGMGILITYGSYMSEKSSVSGAAKLVALADTGVAFCAGLLILPAIFSFNPNTDPNELSSSSVSLIFTFLPKIFLAMQSSIGYIGASIVAALFFLLVLVAAITSLISIIETPISGSIDQNTSRKKSLLYVLTSMTLIAAACAMSFGMADIFTRFVSYAGAQKSLFDLIVDVFYDTILPLNGFAICLLVIFKWKKHGLNSELEKGDNHFNGSWLQRYVNVSLTTFIPLLLLFIFINTVLSKFFAITLI